MLSLLTTIKPSDFLLWSEVWLFKIIFDQLSTIENSNHENPSSYSRHWLYMFGSDILLRLVSNQNKVDGNIQKLFWKDQGNWWKILISNVWLIFDWFRSSFFCSWYRNLDWYYVNVDFTSNDRIHRSWCLDRCIKVILCSFETYKSNLDLTYHVILFLNLKLILISSRIRRIEDNHTNGKK